MFQCEVGKSHRKTLDRFGAFIHKTIHSYIIVGQGLA